ncbi:MAG: trimethylamine methyltransferase family protein [Thermoproteota archaeon]
MLSDSDIHPLEEGVFSVLEKVGVLCQNKEILNALDAKGARVDYSKGTCVFPRKMQEECLERIRREESKKREHNMKFNYPSLPQLETQVAQFIYDYQKKERRAGNKRDFIELIKLGETLHPEVGVGHCLLLTDVPAILEPLEAAVLLAEYSRNPLPAFAWNVRQIDYLVEMGKVLGIENWFNWGAICFAHPLRWDRDTADKFVRRVKSGYPTGLTAMPVAGVTAPATVAGFIVVASAEFFATWIAARTLNENVKLEGSMWAGSIDMKTGSTSYSAPDAMFYSFATVEFLRRWCGKEIPVGGGEYCDAKLPGLYTALEKAYKAMTIAAFTGHHPPVGQGMLEGGKTISPVQLLLERELGVGVQIYSRTIDITPESIALDTIFDVGFGLSKKYLQTRHTLRHYRDSLWIPELIDRSGWNGFEYERKILDKAQRKVNDLISEYEKPEVDEGKISRMREIVKRAQKELLF